MVLVFSWNLLTITKAYSLSYPISSEQIQAFSQKQRIHLYSVLLCLATMEKNIVFSCSIICNQEQHPSTLGACRSKTDAAIRDVRHQNIWKTTKHSQWWSSCCDKPISVKDCTGNLQTAGCFPIMLYGSCGHPTGSSCTGAAHMSTYDHRELQHERLRS